MENGECNRQLSLDQVGENDMQIFFVEMNRRRREEKKSLPKAQAFAFKETQRLYIEKLRNRESQLVTRLKFKFTWAHNISIRKAYTETE